jgi:hypothetical protein
MEPEDGEDGDGAQALDVPPEMRVVRAASRWRSCHTSGLEPVWAAGRAAGGCGTATV